MLIRRCWTLKCKKFLGLAFYEKPFFQWLYWNIFKWEETTGICPKCHAEWNEKYDKNSKTNREKDFMEGYIDAVKNNRKWGGDE